MRIAIFVIGLFVCGIMFLLLAALLAFASAGDFPHIMYYVKIYILEEP